MEVENRRIIAGRGGEKIRGMEPLGLLHDRKWIRSFKMPDKAAASKLWGDFANAHQQILSFQIAYENLKSSDPIETYALTCIELLQSNVSAIADLLRLGYAIEPIQISRSIMEIFFNLKWILDAKDANE